MDFTSRYGRTLSHVRYHWPTFLLGYGGGIVLLIIICALSLTRGWYSFALLALVGLLVLVYFLGVSLWAYHTLYDNNSIREALFALGGLAPEMTVVDVSLGRRDFAAALSRRLTTGKVIVLDVYNPHQAPNRDLVRAHAKSERPPTDPRLSWRDGSINLLPLPDSSVQAVTLVQTASELWQEGDRLKLMREINRVLKPGGCLLLAERVRTPINFVVSGPAGIRYLPAGYWRNLLKHSDFKVTGSRSLRDLILCSRFDKRQVGEAKPLPVDG